mmetsp:Transcript_5269/g.17621  ORF Transcript_5269/g.17621 Transcript_5269/m.17621 type:complete len:461 (+) Transcript_5269:716-2098(+)
MSSPRSGRWISPSTPSSSRCTCEPHGSARKVSIIVRWKSGSAKNAETPGAFVASPQNRAAFRKTLTPSGSPVSTDRAQKSRNGFVTPCFVFVSSSSFTKVFFSSSRTNASAHFASQERFTNTPASVGASATCPVSFAEAQIKPTTSVYAKNGLVDRSTLRWYSNPHAASACSRVFANATSLGNKFRVNIVARHWWWWDRFRNSRRVWLTSTSGTVPSASRNRLSRSTMFEASSPPVPLVALGSLLNMTSTFSFRTESFRKNVTANVSSPTSLRPRVCIKYSQTFRFFIFLSTFVFSDTFNKVYNATYRSLSRFCSLRSSRLCSKVSRHSASQSREKPLPRPFSIRNIRTRSLNRASSKSTTRSVASPIWFSVSTRWNAFTLESAKNTLKMPYETSCECLPSSRNTLARVWGSVGCSTSVVKFSTRCAKLAIFPQNKPFTATSSSYSFCKYKSISSTRAFP